MHATRTRHACDRHVRDTVLSPLVHRGELPFRAGVSQGFPHNTAYGCGGTLPIYQTWGSERGTGARVDPPCLKHQTPTEQMAEIGDRGSRNIGAAVSDPSGSLRFRASAHRGTKGKWESNIPPSVRSLPPQTRLTVYPHPSPGVHVMSAHSRQVAEQISTADFPFIGA